MTVHFECQCGRKLQAQDEFRGKRVRCRSCGEVMLVPGMAKEQVPIREVVQPQRTARTEPSSEEHQAVADGKEKVRRRKKKKKKGVRFSLPAVDIFGIQLTLRTGLAAICVAILIGGFIWVMVPSYHPKIVEARWADVYAALEINDPATGNIITRPTGNEVRPGSDRFLIVRDTPEGEGVVIRLKLPPKFLLKNSKTRAGTLMLTSKEFLLQGSGEPVEALLLELERSYDPSEGVIVDLSKSPKPDPALPKARPPFAPQGEFDNHFEAHKDERDLMEKSKEMTRLGDLHQLDENTSAIIGTGTFKGKRGMVVNYEFGGSFAKVTWDPQSKGHVAAAYLEYVDRFMLESLEMVIVFPRPEGKELFLIVMGEKVGPIKPR